MDWLSKARCGARLALRRAFSVCGGDPMAKAEGGRDASNRLPVTPLNPRFSRSAVAPAARRGPPPATHASHATAQPRTTQTLALHARHASAQARPKVLWMNRRPRENAFARRVVPAYGLLEANPCGRRWSPAFGGMPPHSAKTVSRFDLAWMRFETVRRALMRDGQKQRHAVPRSRDVRSQTWASTLRKSVGCAAIRSGVQTRSSVPTLCRTGKGCGTHFEHGSRAKAGEKQRLPEPVKPVRPLQRQRRKAKAQGNGSKPRQSKGWRA